MSEAKGHTKGALSKEVVLKLIAESEKEMKEVRRKKQKRQQSIGKISLDLRNTLQKRLSTRISRKQFADRLILKENTKARGLFGSLSGKKGGLENFLINRPKRHHLVSLNIISEGKEGVCPSENVDIETKRKAKRNENLSLLLQRRPNIEALRKKKIIIDPDAIDRKVASNKLKNFLRVRPKMSSQKVISVLSDKKSTKNNILNAKNVLGGFLAKRSQAAVLHEKKILEDISHIHLPHVHLGDQLSVKVLKIPNISVVSVSCGWSHSVIIDASGLAYSFGMGQNGRLGQGDEKDVATPTLIKALNAAGKVTQIDCGDNHTIAVAGGGVYTWGMGSWGRLGHGDQKDQMSPKKVNGIKAKFAAGGGYHSLVVDTDGNVHGFGWNRKGQIGVNSAELTVAAPVPIPGLSKIATVCCGTTTSGALSADGKVYVWGAGGSGLGLGNTGDLPEPVELRDIKEPVLRLSAGATHFVAQTQDSLLSWGSNTFGELGREGKTGEMLKPVAVPGLKTATDVSCGRNYTAVIANDKLYVCGKGSKGVLGTGNTRNVAKLTAVPVSGKVKAVECGYAHTLAATAAGELVICGSRDHGRLGDKAF